MGTWGVLEHPQATLHLLFMILYAPLQLCHAQTSVALTTPAPALYLLFMILYAPLQLCHAQTSVALTTPAPALYLLFMILYAPLQLCHAQTSVALTTPAPALYLLFMILYAPLPAVSCPNLRSPLNGQVSTTDSNRFLSVATYSCNAGYQLIGTPTRQCQSTGIWSERAPGCFGNSCLYIGCSII